MCIATDHCYHRYDEYMQVCMYVYDSLCVLYARVCMVVATKHHCGNNIININIMTFLFEPTTLLFLTNDLVIVRPS